MTYSNKIQSKLIFLNIWKLRRIAWVIDTKQNRFVGKTRKRKIKQRKKFIKFCLPSKYDKDCRVVNKCQNHFHRLKWPWVPFRYHFQLSCCCCGIEIYLHSHVSTAAVEVEKIKKSIEYFWSFGYLYKKKRFILLNGATSPILLVHPFPLVPFPNHFLLFADYCYRLSTVEYMKYDLMVCRWFSFRLSLNILLFKTIVDHKQMPTN